jgi:hypothetical protein
LKGEKHVIFACNINCVVCCSDRVAVHFIKC